MFKDNPMEKLIIPLARQIILANHGWIFTSDLIDKLTEAFKPEERWLRILRNRYDTYFSQIVRNLVCHRDRKTNAIHGGILYYNPEKGIIYI